MSRTDALAKITHALECMRDESARPGHYAQAEEAIAALDSLAAELERLRGAEYMAERWPDKAIALKQRAEAAEAELERRDHALELMESGREALASRNAELVAELERVKAERDAEGTLAADEAMTHGHTQARLDKALAALREIESMREPMNGRSKLIARRCLAEIEGEA